MNKSKKESQTNERAVMKPAIYAAIHMREKLQIFSPLCELTHAAKNHIKVFSYGKIHIKSMNLWRGKKIFSSSQHIRKYDRNYSIKKIASF